MAANERTREATAEHGDNARPHEAGIRWHWSIPGLTTAPSRQYAEYLLTHLVFVMRELVGENFRPRSVAFTHPAHEHVEILQQFFQCPLHFDMSQNDLHIDENDLRRTIVGAVPALVPMIETLIAETVAAKPNVSLAERVRALFPTLLVDPGHLQKNIVAALHLTPRTLQRKLKIEGTSLVQELDRFRKDRTATLLLHTEQSCEAIAATLGYSDVRAFTRACQRWMGKTPSAFRAQARPTGQPGIASNS